MWLLILAASWVVTGLLFWLASLLWRTIRKQDDYRKNFPTSAYRVTARIVDVKLGFATPKSAPMSSPTVAFYTASGDIKQLPAGAWEGRWPIGSVRELWYSPRYDTVQIEPDATGEVYWETCLVAVMIGLSLLCVLSALITIWLTVGAIINIRMLT